MSVTSDLAIGIAASLAGAALLLNLSAVATLDQRTGAKVNAWLKRRFGDSFLTHDVWSVRTPTGMRASKIGLTIAGSVLLFIGLALQAVSLFRLSMR